MKIALVAEQASQHPAAFPLLPGRSAGSGIRSPSTRGKTPRGSPPRLSWLPG